MYMRTRTQRESRSLSIANPQRRQVLFTFKTKVGLFLIRQNIRGLWELWLDDERHGSYASPMLAAEDVHAKATGASEWDCSDDEGPYSIEEWQRHFKG